MKILLLAFMLVLISGCTIVIKHEHTPLSIIHYNGHSLSYDREFEEWAQTNSAPNEVL